MVPPPLVDWRKRQGYATELLGITTTSATAIKSLINDRYLLGKLKYVVLVGDYAQIPYYSFSGTSSDMWYACLTTTGSTPDLYPDVGLGRLSGTTTAVIAHQVSKILGYEQNPPAGTWYTQTILAAHRELAPSKYVGCCEEIAAGPLGSSGWTIHKEYGHLQTTSNAAVSALIDGGAADCKPYLADIPVTAQAAKLTLTGSGKLGTTMGLALSASADGGLRYQLGSAFDPGPLLVDQRTLGLGLDSLLVLSVGGALPSAFVGYSGQLSAQGTAAASLMVLPIPALVGFEVRTAFLTLDAKSPSGVRSMSPPEVFRVLK